jgi:hypothetical protein
VTYTRWDGAALGVVLETVRQHGCITTGALARLACLTETQAEYALRLLWQRGSVRRYALGRVCLWCADGPPGSALVLCQGALVRVNVARLADAAARAVESGARLLRPPRLAPRQCMPALHVAAALLRAALAGSAVEYPYGRCRTALLVTDPRAAAERLRRVAETGTLPLEPDQPPNGPLSPRPRERMVLVTVHVPREWIERLDRLVRRGIFPSRSKAVRAALRGLIDKYKSVE